MSLLTVSCARECRRRHRGHLARSARAVPARARRLLLPDAWIDLRGRGRGPGHDVAGLAGAREVRGPGRTAAVAVTDRGPRLATHAAASLPPRPTRRRSAR